MKILLVEDELAFSSEVIAEIDLIIGSGNVELASNKEEAISKIDSGFYDLILLDLKIPAFPGALDIDTNHGEAVFGHCRSQAEGTPICFLTASSTVAFVMRLLNDHSSLGDYWGENSNQVGVRVIPKAKLSEALDYIAECNEKVRRLHEIEVKSGEAVELSLETQRVLRLFTSRIGGVACDYSVLKGGMSKVSVYKALIENDSGRCISMAVGRIGDCTFLQDEGRRFDSIVSALGVGSFPSRLIAITCGAKSTGGIFYRLADRHGNSFFDYVLRDDKFPSDIIARLKDVLQPWVAGSNTKRVSIRTLRQCLVSDEDALSSAQKYSVTWQDEIEAINIVVPWGSIHGDLHGGNILISEKLEPILIDFGDADGGGIPLDPTTLLLSPFFHPDLADKMKEVFTVEKVIQMLDAFGHRDGPEVSSYFSACLDWIKESCNNSQKAIYASIYSFALKQLKYPDTDKELAKLILELSREKILGTIQ